MNSNRESKPETEDVEEQLSDLLHALRATRRRLVIHSLENDSHEVVPTRLLARQIAAKENGVEVGYVSGEPYKNVYNALSQTHLPTLTSADIIVYDSKRQTVQKGAVFDLGVLLLNLTQPTIETFFRQCAADVE